MSASVSTAILLRRARRELGAIGNAPWGFPFTHTMQEVYYGKTIPETASS